MTNAMQSIKSYNLADLQDLLTQAGQQKFRLKQLIEWLYIHPVDSYDQMTNLPLSLRGYLADVAPLTFLTLADRQISKDGTRKYLFRLHDGELVESVGIPSTSGDDRLTVCFSTQVGCAMGCVFCATGKQGFSRNLGMGEIIDQILFVQNDIGERVSNIVAMGQGEPFLNYDNVLDAIRVLNDPKGIAIGARKITVSTCGIVPGIERFALVPEQFTLAISLHSAIQQTRDSLMPHASRYNLAMLKKSLIDYQDQTNRRITFEYTMIRGVNDSEESLRALISFCKGLQSHINFIMMNSVQGSIYQPSTMQTLKHWLSQCEKHGITATQRISRGSDINGACGQLRNHFTE